MARIGTIVYTGYFGIFQVEPVRQFALLDKYALELISEAYKLLTLSLLHEWFQNRRLLKTKTQKLRSVSQDEQAPTLTIASQMCFRP